jgi:hypothetical protein
MCQDIDNKSSLTIEYPLRHSVNTKFISEVFMEEEIMQIRMLAVQRFKAGESPESICTSLSKSRFWLYKWVKRFDGGDPSWFENRSRRPLVTPNRTASEIEEIVKMVRLNLYNQDLFCGAQAILWEMEDLGIKPLPSPRTINRILSRKDLTHRRTGRYEPKGTAYPALPSLLPNQTHQADFIGPCYLQGPIRFYSLNIVDTESGVGCILHFPWQHRQFLMVSGQHGNDSVSRIAFRLTMPCLSSAVGDTLAGWGLSSDSAYTMALNRGSFPWASHGETGWLKTSTSAISKGFLAKCP